MRAAMSLRRTGPYQLQAAIAGLHAHAETAKATDWRQIVLLYARLGTLLPTPIVALNHAVAVAMAGDLERGLSLIADLEVDLPTYGLLHSARADLLRRQGRTADAIAAYQRALDCVSNDAERRFVARRLSELSPKA